MSYIALLIQVSVLFGAHMMRSFINSLSSSQRYLHEAGKQLVSKVVIISYHAYSQTRLYCPVLECLAVIILMSTLLLFACRCSHCAVCLAGESKALSANSRSRVIKKILFASFPNKIENTVVESFLINLLCCSHMFSIECCQTETMNQLLTN